MNDFIRINQHQRNPLRAIDVRAYAEAFGSMAAQRSLASNLE
ncbi:hypothetical protein [Collimonas silvisoli]|nr:hypothetical protein [Collimonas silvisoli]